MHVAPKAQFYRARRITRLMRGLPVSERVNRMIGAAPLHEVGPFARLDEVTSETLIESGGLQERIADGFDAITYITTGGTAHGFEMWLELPAAYEVQVPGRRVIEAADIPAVIFRAAEIRVLAGRYHGLLGPVTTPATPFIADVILKHDGDAALIIPDDYQGFIYVYEGGVEVEQTLVNPGQLGLLDSGNVLNMTAGQGGARVLVGAGRPLKA